MATNTTNTTNAFTLNELGATDRIYNLKHWDTIYVWSRGRILRYTFKKWIYDFSQHWTSQKFEVNESKNVYFAGDIVLAEYFGEVVRRLLAGETRFVAYYQEFEPEAMWEPAVVIKQTTSRVYLQSSVAGKFSIGHIAEMTRTKSGVHVILFDEDTANKLQDTWIKREKQCRKTYNEIQQQMMRLIDFERISNKDLEKIVVLLDKVRKARSHKRNVTCPYCLHDADVADDADEGDHCGTCGTFYSEYNLVLKSRELSIANVQDANFKHLSTENLKYIYNYLFWSLMIMDSKHNGQTTIKL